MIKGVKILVILGLLVGMIMAILKNSTKIEKFGSDFFHHSQMGGTRKWMKDVEDSYVTVTKEKFTEEEKKEDREEKLKFNKVTGFDPNHYVISKYAPDIKEIDYVKTDIDTWHGPFAQQIDEDDPNTLSRSIEKNKHITSLVTAYEDVEKDLFYRSLELIKSRGGNALGLSK